MNSRDALNIARKEFGRTAWVKFKAATKNAPAECEVGVRENVNAWCIVDVVLGHGPSFEEALDRARKRRSL